MRFDFDFPNVIYATPPNWGETYYGSENKIYEVIPKLANIGDDFKNISIDECDNFKLMYPIDGETALYTGKAFNQDGQTVYPVSVFKDLGDGDFEMVESFKSEQEFLKNAEENITNLHDLHNAMINNHPVVRDKSGNGFRPDLPTFGGSEPYDTMEVWSWDETNLIIGENIDNLEIKSREQKEEEDEENKIKFSPLF